MSKHKKTRFVISPGKHIRRASVANNNNAMNYLGLPRNAAASSRTQCKVKHTGPWVKIFVLEKSMFDRNDMVYVWILGLGGLKR